MGRSVSGAGDDRNRGLQSLLTAVKFQKIGGPLHGTVAEGKSHKLRGALREN
jgi:hypothetical protein